MMRIFTKRTGWVQVLRDCQRVLCFSVAVQGYTFFLVGYQEVLAVEMAE